jgi:hypothetical protein
VLEPRDRAGRVILPFPTPVPHPFKQADRPPVRRVWGLPVPRVVEGDAEPRGELCVLLAESFVAFDDFSG